MTEFQEDGPRELSNTAARKDSILKVCREFDRIEAEIKELRDEKNKLKKDIIAGDLGMKISDFNMARKLVQREQDERDGMLDVMRETFEAHGIGFQMDWVDSLPKITPTQAQAA